MLEESFSISLQTQLQSNPRFSKGIYTYIYPYILYSFRLLQQPQNRTDNINSLVAVYCIRLFNTSKNSVKSHKFMNLCVFTEFLFKLFQMTKTVRPMKEVVHLKSKRKKVSSRKPMLQQQLLRIILLPTTIRIPDWYHPPEYGIILSTTTPPALPFPE